MSDDKPPLKMDKPEQFAEAWAKVYEDEGFKKIVADHDIPLFEQKYMVSLVIGMDWKENDRCIILDIKYNYRPHRHAKSNRDLSSHQGLFYLCKRILTVEGREEPLKPIDKSFSTNSTLESVLAGIIYGDARATDKVKAIESLVRLEEKTTNSRNIKPWERIWCDVIIPNLLQAH